MGSLRIIRLSQLRLVQAGVPKVENFAARRVTLHTGPGDRSHSHRRIAGMRINDARGIAWSALRLLGPGWILEAPASSWLQS